LKRDYKAFKYVIGCSGFGAEGANNDQVWDDLISKNNSCKKFKKSCEFESFDMLNQVLANSHFSGDFILTSESFSSSSEKRKKAEGDEVKNDLECSDEEEYTSTNGSDDSSSEEDDNDDIDDDCDDDFIITTTKKVGKGSGLGSSSFNRSTSYYNCCC
jgi:hypothetical protein